MARVTAQRQTEQFRGVPTMIAAFLRRLRVERPQAGAIMAMVLLTTMIFAAVPRLFNSMSDRGIRYAIVNSPVYSHNIAMSRGDRIEAGPANNVFGPVTAAGVTFQQGLAPSIQSVIDHTDFVIDASRYEIIDPAGIASGFSRFITMRYQDHLDAHIKLVQGRMPAHTDATFTTSDKPPQTLQVIEVAISQATAQALDVKLGDRIPLEGDSSDRLTSPRNGAFPPNIAVDIVGIVSLPNPDDDYWYGIPAIDPPSIQDDGNSTRVYATAIFAPNAYADVLKDTAPAYLNYSYRYIVNPSSFNAGKFNQLAADVRRLDAQYGSAFSGPPTSTSISTQLSDIFSQFALQQRLTISILSLGVIGLLAIAFATIGLVAAFVAEHRRDSIRLLRGRGASAPQIISAQLIEGLVLSVPAALAGYLIATFVVRSRISTISLYAAIGIVVMTTILLVFAVLPLARRGLGALERNDIPDRKTSPRRVAIDIFVVILAVLGVYLLRRRGLAGDSATAEIGGFDPYLAAVPVLLGLATGLIVMRLYRLPMRILAWNASYRSDLVPFLGFRRVARQSAAAGIPLLVILLSIAISVFSSVMMHSIQVGQVNTAWRTVGADYRVDSQATNGLPRDFTLAKVPGVQATAAAYLQQNVLISANQPLFGTVDLLGIDTTGYQKVARHTPVDPHFSAAMLSQPTDSAIGTAKDPIPAIVSRNWVTQQGPKTGDVFSIMFNKVTVSFVIVEIRDQFQGLADRGAFVVVPLGSLQTAITAIDAIPTLMYVRAPASAKQAINASIARQFAPVTLQSRADDYAAVHDSPLIAGAARGFEIGIALAAAYSALAVMIALALTSRARIRDLTYLRTLGLSKRQVLQLTIAEQAPPVVIALIIGTGLGVAVAKLIKPGLDLTAFTGPNIPVPLVIDWLTIVLLVIAIVVAVAAAIGIVSVSAQRANVSGVLRIGDE
jgi:putative ABC transport system permease protein